MYYGLVTEFYNAGIYSDVFGNVMYAVFYLVQSIV